MQRGAAADGLGMAEQLGAWSPTPAAPESASASCRHADTPGRSNSLRCTPTRNTAHSSRVSPRTGPSGSFESRIQTCSWERATSTHSWAVALLFCQDAVVGCGMSITLYSFSCGTACLSLPATRSPERRQVRSSRDGASCSNWQEMRTQPTCKAASRAGLRTPVKPTL